MFLIGDDFSYQHNSSSEFRMSEALYFLFKQYAESDLGIKVNVKIATPSDYF